MRPKYLIGVFVGVMLIYISFYGLSGFGLFGLQLTGDLFKEDFDSLYDWQILGSTAEINPAGQLMMQPPATDRVDVNNYQLAISTNVFTVEVRLKIDLWGTKANAVNLRYYATSFFSFYVSFHSDGIWGHDSTYISTVMDTNWHTYVIVTDASSITVSDWTETVYMDGQLLGVLPLIEYPEALTSRMVLTSWNGALSHWDYIYIDQGSKPPTGAPPPPPTQGTLKISAWADGTQLQTLPVTINDQPYTILSGLLTLNVDPGDYTVFGEYNGITDTETVSVATSQTVYVTLSFGTSPPPPDGDGDGDGTPPDIIGWINALLSDPTVKNMLLLVGIATIGISGILCFAPEKHRAPSLPLYY